MVTARGGQSISKTRADADKDGIAHALRVRLLALDEYTHRLRLVGEVRRLHRLRGGALRVGHAVRIQEVRDDRRLDCEVDVLGDVPVGGQHEFERVQLGGDHADEIAVLIKQRAAGAAGLTGTEIWR